MLIYHGSKDIIKQPVFGYGKRYNDYGLGFYCTESIDLAKEWAVDENRDGYANLYEIDEKKLDVLNLNSNSFCTLHWLGILLENRSFELTTPLAREAKKYIKNEFCVDLSKADIVRGDVYIYQIIDEEMKSNDPRLQ